MFNYLYQYKDWIVDKPSKQEAFLLVELRVDQRCVFDALSVIQSSSSIRIVILIDKIYLFLPTLSLLKCQVPPKVFVFLADVFIPLDLNSCFLFGNVYLFALVSGKTFFYAPK